MTKELTHAIDRWTNPYSILTGSWGATARKGHTDEFLPPEAISIPLYGVEMYVSEWIGNRRLNCLDIGGAMGISAIKMRVARPQSTWTITNFEDPTPPTIAHALINSGEEGVYSDILCIMPTQIIQFWYAHHGKVTFQDGVDMTCEENPLTGKTYDLIIETNGPMGINIGSRTEKMRRINRTLNHVKAVLSPEGKFVTNSLNEDDEMESAFSCGFQRALIDLPPSQIDYFKVFEVGF